MQKLKKICQIRKTPKISSIKLNHFKIYSAKSQSQTDRQTDRQTDNIPPPLDRRAIIIFCINFLPFHTLPSLTSFALFAPAMIISPSNSSEVQIMYKSMIIRSTNNV
jgi:hypothetical protein